MYPNNSGIPIRPHHGMCLAYYVGMGYSEGFNCHMGRMLERFLTNPTVRLTVSTDEICSACPNNKAGCCATADRVEGYDRAVLSACGLSEGEELPFLDLAHRVQTHILSPGRREALCGDCQWTALCQGSGRWQTE